MFIEFEDPLFNIKNVFRSTHDDNPIPLRKYIMKKTTGCSVIILNEFVFY